MATFKDFMRVARLNAKDKTSRRRMHEIVKIIRKNHVMKGLTPELAVKVLEELGPTYVKIGQIASNRSDLLPKAYCDAFANLRDNVSPMSFEDVVFEINKSYQEHFGKCWNEVFQSIDPVPLGSASIAQVHEARLLDGTVVAIKVRRPGVVASMTEDITLMNHLLAVGRFVTNNHRDMLLTLQGFVNELDRTTRNEINFNNELDHLLRFAKVIQDQEGVSSPQAYPEFSTDAVLVMEYVRGYKASAVSELKAQGVDVEKLGNRIVKSYVKQVLDAGFFHADPHPGNIIVRGTEIVWIDLGMVGQLSASERMLVGKMFSAVAMGDAFELKDAVLGLTHTTGEIDHGKLLSSIVAILNTYSTAELQDINVGNVFTSVIEILREQNLIMNASVTMLARGVVTLEGLVEELAPGISIISVVSDRVIAQEADPNAAMSKIMGMMLSSAGSAQALAKLPMQLSNSLEMLDRGQLGGKLDVDVSRKVLATAYSAVGRLSLALLSAGLFIGSAILCTTDMEPRILEVPVIGMLGFIGSLILGVRTIWRIMVSHHRVVNGEDIMKY